MVLNAAINLWLYPLLIHKFFFKAIRPLIKKNYKILLQITKVTLITHFDNLGLIIMVFLKIKVKYLN